MTTGTIALIVLIVLLVLMFAGGFNPRFGGSYGYGYGPRANWLLGVLMIILLVILILNLSSVQLLTR